MILYQNICCCVLLCNITKSSMEAVADPTWVVNNSHKILNVQIILYWITCCIWLVQSILATYVAYIDMYVVLFNRANRQDCYRSRSLSLIEPTDNIQQQ